MIVSRVIGDVSIMVNTEAPNELYLPEYFLVKNKIKSQELDQTLVCDILSSNRSYIPLALTWELLDKCSFACPFCYIVGHSNNKIIRFREMKPTIAKLVELGLLYCTLTGGETLLHPDFKEIFSYLKESGVIVEVYTNGSLINNEIVQLFSNLKPYKVEISIYGLDNELFEQTVNTDKYLSNDILENIMLLKRNGINVFCKTPLNKLTEPSIENIRKWCLENGLTHYYSTNVDNAYDNLNLQNYSVDTEYRAMYEALKLKDSKNEISEETNRSKSCYTCGVRRYGLHINSAFEYMPCSETHLIETKTNLLRENIDTALSKARKFVESFMDKPILGCSGCDASEVCKMCTAKSDIVRKNNEILYFKVPANHCDKTLQFAHRINNYLLTLPK